MFGSLALTLRNGNWRSIPQNRVLFSLFYVATLNPYYRNAAFQVQIVLLHKQEHCEEMTKGPSNIYQF